MRTLNHPSIVKLLGFIETKDYYFLILELMNGGEVFHQIVKLTYFSEDLARHCIRQVAEGIRYLHEEKGVVHRDIKPENILFEPIPFMEQETTSPQHHTHPFQNEEETKESEGEFVPGLGGGCIGIVKIADFGLSKVIWDKHTMTPCGTVGYTAPEIVKDEQYSKSVDTWALGCVLYTMLCGFPPFYDENIATLTRKVAKGKYSFLSPWWDHISVDAKHLVRHLLEINPKKRYTIDQFLAHPWMMKQKEDKENCNADVSTKRSNSRNTPDLITIPTSTTNSVTTETVSIISSPPREIPQFSYKRKDFALSGITLMKEMFDVSYAVQRMGEERVKCKENRKRLQQQSERRPLPAIYDPLYLISGSDDEDHDEILSQLSSNKKALSPTILNQPVEPVFDLNMDNATLLGRRKNWLVKHQQK
ncbi:MAG: kinase-like domain-containing protein [Benjaminiella poitrasii]|nr:MAG: kinase-like domain-containing protein [Benjaminiella poitrasii]